jgi:hypothetical protein
LLLHVGQSCTLPNTPRERDSQGRKFMKNLIAMKEREEIFDLPADGANVAGTLKSWNLDVGRNSMKTLDKKADAIPMNLKAVVQDGKITRWETGSASK